MSDIATIQSRLAGRAAAARDRAEANRAKAPEFAEFVDAIRARVPEARVAWVRWPDGSEQGKRVTFPPRRIEAAAKPRARASDPATSKQAARVALTLAADHQQRILAALVEPSTCYELAARIGMNHVAVARRLPELRDAGLVRETGKTRAGDSGRQCTVWARAA